MWSETLVTVQDIEFMAFPRLGALSELGWSPKSAPNRTLASFQSRIATHGARWQLRSQNFYPTTQAPWGVDVSADDIEQAGSTVDGVVASVAAPGATLAQLSATIDWGDGETTTGTITGTEATNKTSNGVYAVSGSHTYARPGGYTAKVTVRKGTAASATARATVSIDATAAAVAGGSVPATLALSVGTASFGAFTPGVTKDYTAALTGSVVSTAGDATLSVTDPSSVATGHLVNGSFSLPSALQASASSPLGQSSGAFAPVGGSASPLALLTYAGPVSNDPVTVTFKQPIAATDALRTGSYAKTLTFTLATTTP
jgi:hexosaminidase